MRRYISDDGLQLNALDGLRGFAVLIVLLSHTSNSSMFFVPFLDLRGAGKSGVFLFFLLSSFLLSRALIKQDLNLIAINSLIHYFQRRFFRVFPLYFAYLLIAILSTLFFIIVFHKQGLGVPFSLNWDEFLNHIFLIEGKGVTWSIAVEFKFYFFLPLLIFFILVIKNKFGLTAELLFLTLLLFLSQGISPQHASEVNDVRLLPYLCVFLIGTIAAVIQCEIEERNISKHQLVILVPLSYISVILLIATLPSMTSLIVGYSIPNNFFHKYFIQFSLLWGVILLSIINFDTFLSSFFKLEFLSFFGAISFSFYLFHIVFIGFLKHFDFLFAFSAWFVLLGSTITSYLSFKYFEMPISKISITSLSKNNNK